MGTIRVDEVSDSIFTVSLNNSLVEERSVSVTKNSPPLFSTLDVVGFFFSKKVMVLLGKLLLQGMVMLGGRFGLLVKEL